MNVAAIVFSSMSGEALVSAYLLDLSSPLSIQQYTKSAVLDVFTHACTHRVYVIPSLSLPRFLT